MTKSRWHIGLLRHGEVCGGKCFRGNTDDPLTEKGWLQMWNEVENSSICWDQIVSSPLKRCFKFAREFGVKHSIPVYIEKRFQEIYFGEWEGRNASDILVKYGDLLSRYWGDPVNNTPPNAESLLMFNDRVMSGWSDVLSASENKNTLVVTHGGVIRLLLCQLQHHPIRNLLDLEVGYACLNYVLVNNCKLHNELVQVIPRS